MVKLDATKYGKHIRIHEDSFGHLLSCLDNQKFINEAPPCGDAIAMGKKAYDKVNAKNQAAIDDFNRQCRKLWSQGASCGTLEDGLKT